MSNKNGMPATRVHDVVHTPGPWKCERLIDGDGKPYATLYEAHIDLGPCMIWAPPGNKEQEANARLIAKAPELLERLKQLCDLHDPYGVYMTEERKLIKEIEG